MSIIRGVCFILKEFLLRLCWSVFRTIHNVIQAVFWHMNGTAQLVLEGQQPQNYSRSAQILTIRYRNFLDFLLPYTFSDFVCSHEEFTEPEYVLGKDNVCQFFLTDEYAVFAECDPGIETWRLRFGAFQREATGKWAKRLIRMPMASFIRLGEKVGEPEAPICFLFNVARCGSTLVTQMLEHTEQCMAISEPDGLNYIAVKYRDMGEAEELKVLIKAYMNLLCKPVTNPKTNLCFFIKVTSPSVVALEFFYKLYPEATSLFLYRNVVPVAKSIYRITCLMPVLLFTLYAGHFSEAVVENMMNELGISGKDYRMKYKDLLCMGTSNWAICVRQYLNLREAGHTDITCVRYEDVVADPLYALEEILKHCKLPKELAKKGVEAMKENSQKKSLLIGSYNFKAPELTRELRKNMDEMLDRFNVPRSGESDILDGIIAYKGDQ